MKKQLWTLLLAAGLAGAMAGLPASGQVGPGGGGGGGRGAGRGGGRGNFNPQQFRQRMEERMKADMGATDDEWKVLQPKIEKVQELQRQGMAGRFGGFRGMGRRNRGGNNGAAPAAESPVAKASQDLRALLVNDDGTPNKNSTDDQIKAALKTLREAKAKAKEELTAAQKDLQSVVTVRQEAVLVSRGILE